MRNLRKLFRSAFVTVALFLSASYASAQIATNTTPVLKKRPIPMDQTYLKRLGATIRYDRSNKMSAAAHSAMQQQRLKSVPSWQGSFTTAGTTYPYIMAGGNPKHGETTEIETSLIPLSLVFDEYVDANGNPLFVDATPLVSPLLNSPNFERASYTAGFVQFGDAVQRAEFWNVMKDDWHTKLDRPRMLTGVTIEVPPGASQVGQLPDGTLVTFLDENFFVSQLNTILQLEDLKVDELALLIAPNVLLYSGGDPNNCCILGFHTAYESNFANNTAYIQTFAFASYLSPGIFLDPTVADILTMSHEISEFMNDPFVNNAVPPFQIPNQAPGACQGNLETGDPVENFANSGYPVTVDGYTYHPQTEALLQWFSRQVPSSAIGGAYSYPDTSILTGPSMACPAKK